LEKNAVQGRKSKITKSDPISLITISHQSNSSGEQWARSIKHKLLNFPLFLVKEDGEASIPEIRISLDGTQEYTSSMAGAALQVAVAGIQQVAPETTVLTTLTEQSTKDKARARLTSRSEIPPVSINAPARMKKGTARSGKESEPVKIF
jgi:hypothetical protein